MSHTMTLGRWGQDAVSEYAIQTPSGGRKRVWGENCVDPARRTPSPGPQFPQQCAAGLWWGLVSPVSTSVPFTAPATVAANGPASPPGRTRRGPNPAAPAARDGATPHRSPPSLPVPLARGTPRGDGTRVRRRCRPGEVHGRTPVFGCHRFPLTPPPPPPRPKSPPSRPCAAPRPQTCGASSRPVGGGGTGWGEAEGGGVAACSEPGVQLPSGRAGAGTPRPRPT